MLGLVEWIMHDVSYSADTVSPIRAGEPPEIGFEGSDTTEEYIDVPIPPGDEAFDPYGYGNRTFRVWRTKAVAGTGTSKENPREHENGATAWLDASALYGSTEDVARVLRSYKHGKLKAAIGKDGREYLPFNNGPETLGMRTRPGVNVTSLFMGGDPRTNEDWIMLSYDFYAIYCTHSTQSVTSVHTLLLREHNRLCGILHSQHPDWDDERLYQTIRLVIGSKVALIGK
jgi:peroxidase